MNKKIPTSRPVYTSKINSTGSTTGRTSSKAPARSNTQKKSSSELDLDAVKLLALTLPVDDQQALLDFLALEKINRGITSYQERRLNAFTDSLANELGKSLGQSHRVFPLPLQAQGKKMWKDAEALLKDLQMDAFALPETKAMYNVIAMALVHHAQMVSTKVKIPVNMKLVLQTTTPLHALLDNHFPGYIKAGVMSMVFQQAKNGFVEDSEDD